MSLSEDVRPLLAARAATDPNAARLLEMFTKADEILSERSLECAGSVGNGRAAFSVSVDSAPSGQGFVRHRGLSPDALLSV